MSCFTIVFRLCDSKDVIRYWTHIKAFDMGDASYQFVALMKNNLGFKKKDYQIIDIPEEKVIP